MHTTTKIDFMRQFTLVLFLLLPLLSWAQDKKNSLNILGGISFSHQITGEEYHRLRTRTTQQFINKVDRDVFVNVNYRFGLDYQRRIIKGLHAKIGARFSNWGETYTHNHTLIHHEDIYYFELPFSLQYKFGNKALQPYLEIGGSPMFFLGHKSAPYDAPTPSIEVQFALVSTAGLSYQLSPRFSVFGQISGRFKITSNEYDIYPYEIGLELGGAFHF